MSYKTTARVIGQNIASYGINGTFVVPSSAHDILTVINAAGTDYDEAHSTAAFDYSCCGEAAGSAVEATVNAASTRSPAELLDRHLTEFCAIMDALSLNVTDT